MKRPRVELELGQIVFLFDIESNGETHTHRIPCTHEGATEFVLELAGKLEELKGNPELMKKIGAKAVSALVDLFTKKGS